MIAVVAPLLGLRTCDAFVHEDCHVVTYACVGRVAVHHMVSFGAKQYPSLMGALTRGRRALPP